MAVKALTFFKSLFFGVLVVRSAAVFLMLTAGLATLGQGLIQDPPEGRKDGIEVLGPDRAHLQLRAPAKDHVHVRGDFNNWAIESDYLMNRSLDGNTWWLEVDGLLPGAWTRFHYLLDDTIEVADPYAPLVLDPWNDGYVPAETFPNRPVFPSEHASWPVAAFRTEVPDFQWADQLYSRPAQDRLVIYELLVRDWDASRDFNAVVERMDHLEWLGVTAIEIMPVSEFDGNTSWGYNPSNRFAVDKAYGDDAALKRLVNAAHAKGIAVILDVVPNHSFGLDPLVRMYQNESGNVAEGNPWFNEQQIHPYGLGYDFNHGDPWTREFWKRVFDHWLDEFHVDGFRVDLSKGLTQNNTLGDVGAWSSYDQSRVDILFEYANHIWSQHPGTYMILEHLGDNSEETALANGGFLLWGKSTSAFKEAAMGYGGDFSWASWQNRGWSWPNLVAYAESHDEQRVAHDLLLYGNETPDYDVKDLETGMERLAMMHAFLLTLPGPKMMYQWGEFGYDVSIFSCGDGTYQESCKLDEKPEPWLDLAVVPERQDLARAIKAICELKRDEPVFSTYDYSVDFGGGGKRLNLYSPEQNVVLCGNFDMVGFDMNPGFPHTGSWTDAISGATWEVTDLGASVYFAPGQWHLWIDTPVTSLPEDTPLALDETCTNAEALNFGEEEPCDFQLTLAVDVSDLEGASILSPQGIHVAGSFQGWSPSTTPLTLQSNGFWTASFVATEGELVTYKFINGTDWSDEELVPMGCGSSDGFGGFNREWIVSGPDSIGPVCFGGCVACEVNLDFPGCMDAEALNFDAGANVDDGSCQYLVAFEVDVACLDPVPDQVFVAGGFQGWDAAASPMINEGEGVWRLEVTLTGDAPFEYKFLSSSDWADAEEVPELCGTDNGLGGFNRQATPSSAGASLSTVCFGECVVCDCPDTEGPIEDGSVFCGPTTYWDGELGLCMGLITCDEDLDGDGIIGVSDVLALLSVFGGVCP